MILLSCSTTFSPVSFTPANPRQVPVGTPAPTTLPAEPPPSTPPSTAAPAPAASSTTSTSSPPTVFAEPVERWRPEVAVWFKADDVDRVLALISCESFGDPAAYNDKKAANGMNAAGLLQHLDGYWPARAIKANAAGYRNGGDIYNGGDQLAVSAWLAYRTPQGFDHWECNR